MTRTEFNEIDTWNDLMNFLYEENLVDEYAEGIYCEETRDEILEDYLRDSNMTWRDLYRFLSDVPEGYDYYNCYDYVEGVGLEDGDADFEYIRDRILADFDGFEDEELDEIEEEEEIEEDDYESHNIADLITETEEFVICSATRIPSRFDVLMG